MCTFIWQTRSIVQYIHYCSGQYIFDFIWMLFNNKKTNLVRLLCVVLTDDGPTVKAKIDNLELVASQHGYIYIYYACLLVTALRSLLIPNTKHVQIKDLLDFEVPLDTVFLSNVPYDGSLYDFLILTIISFENRTDNDDIIINAAFRHFAPRWKKIAPPHPRKICWIDSH